MDGGGSWRLGAALGIGLVPECFCPCKSFLCKRPVEQPKRPFLSALCDLGGQKHC